MDRWAGCIAALVLALGSAAARAAFDEALAQAAIVVGTFDRLMAECRTSGGSLHAADARKVAAWRADNAVDALRARIAEFDRDPQQRRRVDEAVRGIVDDVKRKRLDVCVAALTTTQLRQAQFARNSPQLMAPSAGVAQRPAGAAAAAAPTPPPSPPQASSRDVAALAARIDSFAFDTRAAMGVGGFITTEVFPIVLFRDGQALTDVAGLTFPGGIEAHQRAQPKRWTRWRRADGRLELQGDKGWKALAFRVTYPSLPAGFRLDGRFQRLSGGGNVGVGGTDSVTAWSEYRFWRDGRVLRGGGVGARAEGGNSSVVTSSVAPNRRGSYRIDGLVLQIAFDDGSIERRLLVTDPNKASVIWLDGSGYTQ